MPPTLNPIFSLTSSAKRFVLAAVALLLIYITLGPSTSLGGLYTSDGTAINDGGSSANTGSDTASKPDKQPPPPPPPPPPAYEPPDDLIHGRELNISEWGERGARVRQLADWADHLMKNPTEDKHPFEKALQRQFPFLNGTKDTLYTPWTHGDPGPTGKFSTEVGYLICAGSKNFDLAAHLIRNLRRVHGSKTPIEIAYAGPGDLREEHREFLSTLEPGISFIDLLQIYPDAHAELVDGGWAMKPFALLASRHTRAILMDADALFLTSPDGLFDAHPALAETGTLFFHDRAAVGGDDARRNWVQGQIARAGIEPSQFLAEESLFYSGAAWYEADSGVVALDRSRPEILLGLVFASWMNTKIVRDEVTYRVFYGDKESFWLALELASVRYAFQPWYAGTMGTVSDPKPGEPARPAGWNVTATQVEICGTHMLHLDHAGEMPFWINGGVYEHKDKREEGYARMTHYWVGDTAEIRLTQPRWYWIHGNVGCLRETGVRDIPDRIVENIKKIQEEAQEVDEMVRNIGAQAS